METWREVPGYEGWYECSTEGLVRSWKPAGRNQASGDAKASHPRILRAGQTRGGYLTVGLSLNGSVKHFRLNRLVLLTHAGPPFEGAQACHRNGDRQDNRLGNLYWGTPLQNAADMIRHGKVVRGEAKVNSRLSRGKVTEARILWASGETVSNLADRYGVSGPTIWKAVTGKTWKEEG